MSNNFIENIKNFLEMHTHQSQYPYHLLRSLLFSDHKAFCRCNLQLPKNPVIVYLNINSLKIKIVDLRQIMSYISLDCFVVSETKQDSSFPSTQFHVNEYKVRACCYSKTH